MKPVLILYWLLDWPATHTMTGLIKRSAIQCEPMIILMDTSKMHRLFVPGQASGMELHILLMSKSPSSSAQMTKSCAMLPSHPPHDPLDSEHFG